ncbi:hypothetical protein [Streptomyces bacillaris]|uniref:hypothetical protein n=1 Tax=Streptomyces bacillaris TaxID=68179 RepID=UPI0034616176
MSFSRLDDRDDKLHRLETALDTCVLAPEQVTEYPNILELGGELKQHYGSGQGRSSGCHTEAAAPWWCDHRQGGVVGQPARGKPVSRSAHRADAACLVRAAACSRTCSTVLPAGTARYAPSLRRGGDGVLVRALGVHAQRLPAELRLDGVKIVSS